MAHTYTYTQHRKYKKKQRKSLLGRCADFWKVSSVFFIFFIFQASKLSVFFCFSRSLLVAIRFDDDDMKFEEKGEIKNYKVLFVLSARFRLTIND